MRDLRCTRTFAQAFWPARIRPDRAQLLAWAVAVALMLGVLGCGQRSPDAAPPAVLRIAQRNEPATLDPHLATLPDEFFIIRALSEGLLAPAPDGGAPVPAVARSWSVSPDGLTYKFQLNSASRWSNGDPVTADDFVFSIHRALAPALAAPKASLFFALKNAAAFYQGREKDFSLVGVRAVTPLELEIVLNEPTADFPAIVASGPWIPVHRATVERAGPFDARSNPWARPENFVGNGPFTLSAWKANQEITVTRSASYASSARIKLAGVRFLGFDSGDTEERAFRGGQVEVTMAVPATKIPTYQQLVPSPLRQVALHETRYLALNTTRPPLNDVRVRRALALALDRRAITDKVLKGGQRPAYSYLPAGLGGYQPGPGLQEDAAAARGLLTAAGFPGGQGFPRLELTSWATTPAVLEAIQQMWRKELGIEIALVQRDARTHLASLMAGDYDLALATAIPDYNGASDLCDDLRSDNAGNFPHWRSAEYDELVAAAAALADPVARNSRYQAAEAVLLREMPLVPLYFNAKNFLIKPTVQGWKEDALWTRFYHDVALNPP